MTQDQQELFIKILQFGFSAGACHRYECLEDYIRAYPRQKEQAISACAAFERGCCYCHESAERLSEMTDDEFYSFVTSYRSQKAA